MEFDWIVRSAGSRRWKLHENAQPRYLRRLQSDWRWQSTTNAKQRSRGIFGGHGDGATAVDGECCLTIELGTAIAGVFEQRSLAVCAAM